MLTAENLTYTLDSHIREAPLLDRISFTLPAGHFMAIVGPSGCGKTTLLKIIAGLFPETGGRLLWRGQDLAEDGDLPPWELGYVPQFSIAHEALTAGECVRNAVRLRTSLTGAAIAGAETEALHVTGLEELADQRVAVLSGGQKRRLGLAMEWVSHPSLMLCDEVTSGLDPRSASEIVHLLHSLSRHPGRSVVNVTHSLDDLHLYDSVLVLTGGRVAYHGSPRDMSHYFSVEEPGEIYPRLALRPPGDWHASWEKRRGFYYGKLNLPVTAEEVASPAAGGSPMAPHASGLPSPALSAETAAAGESGTRSGQEASAPAAIPLTSRPAPLSTPGSPPAANAESLASAPPPSGARTPSLPREERAQRPPGLFRQFQVLLARRFVLFFRDRTQLLLQLALLFGFPLLVVLFASSGIGAMPENPGHSDLGAHEAMQVQVRAVEGQSRLGGLISGLVMFQVVLLTLMGANNASREIAGERLIYEKERLAGLQPPAYVLSKVAFLCVPVICQSLWMAGFVDHFARLPGSLPDRALLLLAVNGAMTAVCLAISALLRSPDQASLLSIYLVGFQLPLSGAVLALPAAVEKIVQPFIASFWSWSGQLAAMRPTDYFVAINRAIPTPVVSDPALPLTILGFHLAAGIIFAWIGCLRHRWD